MSPVVSTNVPDWEEGGARQVGNKPGSIGQPIPGVAARIVNPDTFEPVSVGQKRAPFFRTGKELRERLNGGNPEA